MKQENLVKKLRDLEIKLKRKTKELENSRLESESLYVALDEAYSKLRELYPYMQLLQDENNISETIH